MSVLKYNNNGTWEGLNIDHASTADSALYDGNGDQIDTTYVKVSSTETQNITISVGSTTGTLTCYKHGNSVCGNGTIEGDLSSFSDGIQICTMPEGWRPITWQLCTCCVGASNSTWNTDYTITVASVRTGGSVELRGNANLIKTYKRIVLQFSYVI